MHLTAADTWTQVGTWRGDVGWDGPANLVAVLTKSPKPKGRSTVCMIDEREPKCTYPVPCTPAPAAVRSPLPPADPALRGLLASCRMH